MGGGGLQVGSGRTMIQNWTKASQAQGEYANTEKGSTQ